MKARIQKWGNSLALRIPKAFAAEVQLNQNSLVEVSLVEGSLVVTPSAEGNLTLDQLLSKVTRKNLHGEVNTGSPMGNEAW